MKTKCGYIIIKKSVGKILVVCQKPPSVVYTILIDAIQNCLPFSEEFIEINRRTTLSILCTLHAYLEATSVSLGKMLHDTTMAEVIATAKARRAFAESEIKICISSFNTNTQQRLTDPFLLS